MSAFNKQTITEIDIKPVPKKEKETNTNSNSLSGPPTNTANLSNPKDNQFSRSELRTVLKAMDKEGFDTIMEEYIKEISDPSNIKEQNDFLKQSETNKDLPANITLAKPNMGFCIKTEKRNINKPNSKMKIFINICTLEQVPIPKEEKPNMWSLPYLVNKPRNDMDSKKRHCQSFDVVYHPDALVKCNKSMGFKKFVCDQAVEGINRNILEQNKEKASIDYCIVSKYNYKGEEIALMNIHALNSKNAFDGKKEPANEYKTQMMKEIEEQKKKKGEIPEDGEGEDNEYDKVDVGEDDNLDHTRKNNKMPKYKIKYSDDFELSSHFYKPEGPKGPLGTDKQEKPECKLILELTVPLLKSINDAELEIKDRKVRFKYLNIYDCEIQLMRDILDNSLDAKFLKEKGMLIISGLVIRKNKTEFQPKEDENIEYIKEESEKDRLDREKQEKIDKEKLENEKVEKVEKERIESEERRLKLVKDERLEREKQEKERYDELEKERKEKKAKLELEKQEKQEIIDKENNNIENIKNSEKPNSEENTHKIIDVTDIKKPQTQEIEVKDSTSNINKLMKENKNDEDDTNIDDNRNIERENLSIFLFKNQKLWEID